MPPRPPAVLSVAAITDVGSARNHNEDAFQISEIGGVLRRGLDEVVERLVSAGGFVLGVYDGAGGSGGGDMASATAARIVAEALSKGPVPASPVSLAERLVAAVTGAGEAILDASRTDSIRRGMGTTATVAAVAGDHVVVAHVGDSRAYLLRRRALVQVTRDDTLVQEALRTGSLALEDVAAFPHQNILLQALGSGPGIKVGITTLSARRGDVLLLCTDGVHAMLDAGVLRAILLRHREPGVAARVLLDAALGAGGHDNLALIVARLDGEGLALPEPDDTVEDRGLWAGSAPLSRDRTS